MPGLLDLVDDPNQLGLLSLGMRLMSTPGKFGAALGQAGMGALGDVQQARSAMEARKLREQQMALQQAQEQRAQQQFVLQQQVGGLQLNQAARADAEAQAQAERDAAFIKAIPSPQGQALRSLGADASPTMANAARMPAVDPRSQFLFDALQARQLKPMDYLTATAKDDAPIKLGEGETLLSGKASGYKPLAQGQPKASDTPAAIREYQFAVTQGYKGSFQQFQTEQKKAGATKIDNSQRFENSYSTNQGKEFSELMSNMNKTAFAAPAQLRKLERMETLLDGVDGGKLAPTGLDIASAANTFGIKLDPKLGNKEAAQALAREIAGSFRQPGTGPMTDKDFDNFLLQVPDLSKTAQGRKQITATMKAAANRDMQVAKMAREYERKNGRIDNDFLDMAAQYIAENPVVGAPKGWKVTTP